MQGDKTIYILTNGSTLRRAGQRLLLDDKDKKRLFEVPIKDVGRIFIYSQTEVSNNTLTTIMDAGIPLYYLRRSGALKGKITPHVDRHVSFRQLQHFYFRDDNFCIPIARDIVRTKLHNMEQVIIHLMQKKQGTSAACQPIRNAHQSLEQCSTREEIMGMEGAAARHYFQVLGNYLPPSFQFKLRSRRPAHDAANAMLNLGYMTLLREIHSHIEAHSLDPYLGMLHAIQDGRPSLALDLLEEFRQPIVDLLLVRLCRLEHIKPANFHTTQEGGIEMTDEGLRTFFRIYEQTLGRQDGDNPGLRKLLDNQVMSLKQHILGQQIYEHFAVDLATDSAEIAN